LTSKLEQLQKGRIVFEFKQQTGMVEILKHAQTLESIGNKEVVVPIP
jgi:hypothetical protein